MVGGLNRVVHIWKSVEVFCAHASKHYVVCVANVDCELSKTDLGCTGVTVGWAMCSKSTSLSFTVHATCLQVIRIVLIQHCF